MGRGLTGWGEEERAHETAGHTGSQSHHYTELGGGSLLPSYVASGRLVGVVRCQVQPNSTLMAMLSRSPCSPMPQPLANCREQAPHEKTLCGRDVERQAGTLCFRSSGQKPKQHPRGPGATFTLRSTPQHPS